MASQTDRRARDAIRGEIAKFRELGCAKCAEKCHCCLTAHHLDPAVKSFDIGRAVSILPGIPRLRAELMKCVCLCLNCHAKVHAGVIRL